MKIRECAVWFLCLNCALSTLAATGFELNRKNLGMSHPFHEDMSFDPAFYASEGYVNYTNDLNADGNIDHVVMFDDQGNKSFEILDFDKDGSMDDFYFYRDGVLIRQEIDRNNDHQVDIWIYIVDGIYIEGYEMDNDFDGRIDLIKLYNDE